MDIVLVILQVIFIVLKLASLVDWSWWWVLSPVILPVLFLAFVILLIRCIQKISE